MATPSYSGTRAVLPLLSTTGTLSTAIFEFVVFGGLIKASSRATSSSHYSSATIAKTISAWWLHTVPEGLSWILFLGFTSLITGIRATRAFPTKSKQWYLALAGTIFAVGHFAFARPVVDTIFKMGHAYEKAGIWDSEAEEKGKTTEELIDEAVIDDQRKWLRLHAWRTALTDLPAFTAFAWLVLGA